MTAIIVIEWNTKKIVGYYTGSQAKTWHWFVVLKSALSKQLSDGVRNYNLKLMSDNGSHLTSINFMKACKTMGVEQPFTSYRNPEGSAPNELYELWKKRLFGWMHG